MESNWSAIWQNFLYQKKIERYDDDLIAAGKRWLKPTTRELSKNVATSSCGFSLQELPPPQTVFDHNLRINFAWKAMTMKVLMFSSGWILQPTCFGKARWDQAVNAAVAGYEETASTTLFLNKTPSGARCCSCIQNQSSPGLQAFNIFSSSTWAAHRVPLQYPHFLSKFPRIHQICAFSARWKVVAPFHEILGF